MYKKTYHVHFMGIGGIGMSALAIVLRQQGYVVSGCDLDISSPSCLQLQKLGCALQQGHAGLLCQDPTINAVVYTSAVSLDHPELVTARAHGCVIVHRSELLAELTKQKFSIAVSGSHGKTTTTALIAHILLHAGIDPTVIVGGHVPSMGSNARLGAGDWLVAEADESDRSLVRLFPTLAVVTNIDLEHLDTYRDLSDLQATFSAFLQRLPFYGRAVVCVDDPATAPLLDSKLPGGLPACITYGFAPHAEFQVISYRLEPDHSCATFAHNGIELGIVRIALAGKHMVANALAATAIALQLEIPFETIAQALASFRGVEQRFTYRGLFQGAEVFDDYGHHPTEIRCMLDVARRRAAGKLIVAFQPHRFTRTEKLWHEFLAVFGAAPVDLLLITDIYPASEQPIPGITSERLVAELRAKNPGLAVEYIPQDPDFQAVRAALVEHAGVGDLVFFLGAGKLNKLSQSLGHSKAC